jgi:hypothetical protein
MSLTKRRILVIDDEPDVVYFQMKTFLPKKLNHGKILQIVYPQNRKIKSYLLNY